MTKMKQAALALISVAALSVPSVGLAQMKGPDSGWYVGGHFGQSDIDELSETDTAFRILGGYQINKHFAAELGYTDFGKVSNSGVTFKGNAIELVGVGSLPLTDKFSIYGKLGFAKVEGEASSSLGSAKEDSIEPTYGFGVTYNVSPTLGIRGEYQLYPDVGDGATDVSVLSVGVIFRFK